MARIVEPHSSGERPPSQIFPPAPPTIGGGLPPRRGNWTAVASLVFGVLGCIPEIAGLLAIVLGIIGLRRARDPEVGGKGLAAAGLTLGIVSVLCWSVALTLAALAWTGSGPPRSVARQYLADLSHGNISGVMNASTFPVTLKQVQSLNDRLHDLGNLQDVQFTGAYFGYQNGASQWKLSGQATYANGWATFNITVVRQGDVWKVNGFWINGKLRNPPSPHNLEV